MAASIPPLRERNCRPAPLDCCCDVTAVLYDFAFPSTLHSITGLANWLGLGAAPPRIKLAS
jgi:hypothetical protein